MGIRLAFGGLAFASMLVTSAAWASDLGSANFTSEIRAVDRRTDPNSDTLIDLTHSGTGSFSGYGITTSLAGFPGATASVTTSVPDHVSATGKAEFSYNFEIVGTSLAVPIDVFFRTATSEDTEGTAESGADTYLALLTHEVGFIAGGSQSESTGPGFVSDSLSGEFTGTVLSAWNPYILGFAEASGPSASAFLDPMVTIDPIFFDQHPDLVGQVSLVFSDGVGNAVGGVPEPAAWALMLLGFGELGAALRGRRRTVAA